MSDNRVYQASPSVCVKVARDHVKEAIHATNDGDGEAALRALQSALSWLPSWLEREWDGRMTAWMEREGAPHS